MKKIFLAICFLFLNFTFSQITINGIVKSETNTPLQYVNIGIKNKNVGTISDEKGNFSITIDNHCCPIKIIGTLFFLCFSRLDEV